MSSLTQDKLNWLLAEIDCDVRTALENMSTLIEVDDKFKNCFLQTVTKRLNQTYDRFEIDESFIEHLKDQDENLGAKSSGIKRENSFEDPYKTKDESKPRRIKPRDQTPPERVNSKEDVGMHKLRIQNELCNHILVTGIPRMGSSENLRSIFRKICDEIGVKIGSRNVVHIERMKKAYTGFIVELENAKIKRLIKSRASRQVVSSRDIIKKSQCPDMNIRIVDFVTPHFLNIIRYANQAIERNLISSVNITLHGVLVRRDPNHNGRTFLLLAELKEYIHQLEERDKRLH